MERWRRHEVWTKPFTLLGINPSVCPHHKKLTLPSPLFLLTTNVTYFQFGMDVKEKVSFIVF